MEDTSARTSRVPGETGVSERRGAKRPARPDQTRKERRAAAPRWVKKATLAAGLVLLQAAVLLAATLMPARALVVGDTATITKDHVLDTSIPHASYMSGSYVTHEGTEVFCVQPNIIGCPGENVPVVDLLDLTLSGASDSGSVTWTQERITAAALAREWANQQLDGDQELLSFQLWLWSYIELSGASLPSSGAAGNMGVMFEEASGHSLDEVARYIEQHATSSRGRALCYLKQDGSQSSATFWVERGWIGLEKSSANTEMTLENNCYSLAGAQYGVYGSEADAAQDRSRLGTLTTGESGASTTTLAVIPGSYYLRELSPAKGFALDESIHIVSVANAQTATARVFDQPQSDAPEIVVAKLDEQTGEASPQGAATLAGAEFTLRYYAGIHELSELPVKATRSWVVRTDANGTASLDEAHLVSGDALYRQSSGTAALPLGTLTIQETKAPEGYLLNDELFVRHITSTGTQEQVSSYQAPVVADRVKRGDFQLNKAVFPEQSRLANVAFLIESDDTGEAHVAVTDENGVINSSSSWVRHVTYMDDDGVEHATNANDALLADNGTSITNSDALDAQAGIWFFGSATGTDAAPDDTLGALPYGSYTIRELRCAANEGRQLITLKLRVRQDGRNIDLGTVSNLAPGLKTSLTGQGGARELEPAEALVLTDAVSYSDLIPGQSYTLVMRLWDKTEQAFVTTGGAQDDDGAAGGDAGDQGDGETGQQEGESGARVLEVSRDFVAESSNGTLEQVVELDASGLAGHSLVAFEWLYDEQGALLAEHASEDDHNQTVSFAGPSIATTATGEDGGHELAATSEASITDHVQYTGLTPGQSYRIEGTLHLMDANGGDEGALAGEDGLTLSSAVEFVAQTEAGVVEVPFVINAAELAGRKLVVFETLTSEGSVVATHADMSNASQTISFAEAPKEPEEGADPIPRTGDGYAVGATATAAAAGLAFAVLGAAWRRKDR